MPGVAGFVVSPERPFPCRPPAGDAWSAGLELVRDARGLQLRCRGRSQSSGGRVEVRRVVALGRLGRATGRRRRDFGLFAGAALEFDRPASTTGIARRNAASARSRAARSASSSERERRDLRLGLAAGVGDRLLRSLALSRAAGVLRALTPTRRRACRCSRGLRRARTARPRARHSEPRTRTRRRRGRRAPPAGRHGPRSAPSAPPRGPAAHPRVPARSPRRPGPARAPRPRGAPASRRTRRHPRAAAASSTPDRSAARAGRGR